MEKQHQGIIVALHIFSVSLSLSVVLIFKPQEVGLSFSPSTSYKHSSTFLSVRLAFDLDSSDKFVNCKFSWARTTHLHTLARIIVYICLPEKCLTFRSWSCRDPSVFWQIPLNCGLPQHDCWWKQGHRPFYQRTIQWYSSINVGQYQIKTQ